MIVPRVDICLVWCSQYISHMPLSLTATLSTQSGPQPVQKCWILFRRLGSASVFISDTPHQWWSVDQWSEGAERMGYLWPSAWRENGQVDQEQKCLWGTARACSSADRGAAASGLEGVESKASEWVCHSNCYHTWQRLVWDPVVHAAYVSSWSSSGQSDRGWRITHHIRLSATGCVWHTTGSSAQHNGLLPLLLSDLLDDSRLVCEA